MSTICDAMLVHSNTTAASAAAVSGVSTDNALTILFGTMGLLLATLRVVLSWQNNKALRRRDVST
jgi:hypothetical protein